MKTLSKILAASAIASVGFATTACAGPQYKTETTAEAATADVVQTAMSVDDLSTLVAAVKAADLVDALSADGPITVFAPTNAAFEALPAGTVSSLLEPQNKDALTRILTSHVVPGTLDSAALTAAAEANGGEATVTTLSGATLTAVLQDGVLIVRDETGGLASVATPDVTTSNGVVHVVDGVLVPADSGS